MADYSLRSAILSDYAFLLKDIKEYNNMHARYRKFIEMGYVPEYLKGLNHKDIETLLFSDVEFANDLYAKNLAKYGKIWLEAERLDNCNKSRKNRLRTRISKQLTQPAMTSYFATLTFTDAVFESTNAETRRKYVRRYLKSISNDYVANIDFGAEKGREHYHAIINCADKFSFDWWHQHCGAIQIEKIRYDVASPVRLAKYITKLSNHAVKETADRNHLIYSRKKQKIA